MNSAELTITIIGVVLVLINILGFGIKSTEMIFDYDIKYKTFIGFGLQAFYYFTISAKRSNNVTVFGLILLAIIDTLMLPISIFVLIFTSIIELIHRLCVKKR